jgi:HKD family nuclease
MARPIVSNRPAAEPPGAEYSAARGDRDRPPHTFRVVGSSPTAGAILIPAPGLPRYRRRPLPFAVSNHDNHDNIERSCRAFMRIESFIFQGFTAKTHLDAVRWILACPGLMRTIFSVAYVKVSGVELLRPQLKRLGSQATVFAGIRNGVTSRQGLQMLLDLGVTTYAVDTGSRQILFHPKIFFAQGPTKARFVIGSANLTHGGLNNNIEGGLQVELDLGDDEDRNLGQEIDSQLSTLPSMYPQNIIPVKKTADLVLFEKSGRLLDESLVIAPHPTTTAQTPADDKVPKIALLVPRIYAKIKEAKTTPPLPTPVAKGIARRISVSWAPVWQSKPLTERDLQIPTSRKTHPTGSMNLDKGLLPATVDHRHYFRDEVFTGLTWAREKPTVEASTASCQLVVKGISYGEAELPVAHTTSTSSKSYKQKNAMTRLSWGVLKPFIAHRNLLGRTLTLYRDTQDVAKFLIEID